VKVVEGYPPMIDEIDRAFNVRGRSILFCWGDTIFAPKGGVSPVLMAHERVHSAQQGKDIEGWWRRYIAEPAFRLAQELPAHRAEYRYSVTNIDGSRHGRRRALAIAAERLASPLYRYGLKKAHAKALLLEGVT
jgi:hypothetical protein